MRIPMLLIAGAGIVLMAWTALGQGQAKFVRARLSGYQEVPTVSTTASGEFRGRISRDDVVPTDTEMSYELSYSGLEGNVTQAHIHIGARGTNGGIMIWLCGTAVNPGPPGTPSCPAPGGTVTGTVTARNVIGPAGQGIAAGEFEEALRAIRAGVAYANVHSTMWPGGEIRGQIADEDRD